MASFGQSVRVGIFLGVRQLKRANRSTTILIISIMTFTFLNLVVVSGILVGLIVGGNIANRNQYTGDVIATTLSGKTAIDNSQNFIATIAHDPQVTAYTARYLAGGTIEANYKTRTDFSNEANSVGGQIAGVDPSQEDDFSHISQYVVEGSFLTPGESGYIVLGSDILDRYSASFGQGFDSLKNVYPGNTVKVTINGNTREFIVKGIVKSKVGQVSLRSFMSNADFIQLSNRTDMDVNEIALEHNATITDDQMKARLVADGFTSVSQIQTATEAIPDFLTQIKTAFSLLGNLIGAIGIVVGSITIFIVVFINAVTRRKFIGILKGIGVSPMAIQVSYLLQSLFYGLCGSLLGSLILYGLLVPAFNAHPLNFPFSDGILVADIPTTIVRIIILLVVTLIAGYIPARNIIRKNTLDSILGR
ncbi:MAG TPA: FtsX-like permease family protein [Candidatus Paceibacterota bacterium]|jgi:putative ABC transport system permease protein|nr:FtsX-like permease family protein [Candidatus Paceibacterota bacterium]